MKKVWFDVEDKNGKVTHMGFAIRNCCLFGWAGRNKDEIRKHAAELAEHGIRAVSYTHLGMTLGLSACSWDMS